jgi:NAD(P)-dependent dehydrogenase (short-subunit alcohol dehydrogenase family)
LRSRNVIIARGVRVNAVTPGCIATPLTAQDDAAMQAAIDGYVAGAVPMGRWGSADDVAGAVSFLAGADSAYVTGSEIVVDGGLAQI